MPPAFSRLLPHLALLVAMLFWSTSYPAMRIALTGLDPVTLMFGRMLAATLVLLPALPSPEALRKTCCRQLPNPLRQDMRTACRRLFPSLPAQVYKES